MKSIRMHYRARCRAVLSLVLLAALAAAVLFPRPVMSSPGTPAGQEAGAGAASMEAIHGSYLDLTANIADLRTRVGEWQKDDEGSLNIATEKLERIQVVLSSVVWPHDLSGAIAKTQAAVAPMSKALKAKDFTAAQPAAKAFGDASHDVTHAFYGDWLPALRGAQFTSMAPHASYLDLAANISDLRTRIAQWQEGDENSLDVAKEKAERMSVLVQHMTSFGVLAKPVRAIGAQLPAIIDALEHKDGAAVQGALQPIVDASHDLTHDFYQWLDITSASENPDCIQAAYLDLLGNISDLRTRIAQTEAGDEASLNIAQEKLERVEVVLTHVMWPGALSASIGATQAAIAPMKHALKNNDLVMAQQTSKLIADSLHDVTHAYYGDWLPGAHAGSQAQHMGSDMSQAVPKTAAGESGGHSDAKPGESAPHGSGTAVQTTSASARGIVLGGFGAVNGLVIVLAAILKAKNPKKLRASPASQAATTTGGTAE